MTRVALFFATLVTTATFILVIADQAFAQSVSAADREALVQLRVDRGGRAEDVDALLKVADEAAAKKLPIAPITNKIREGLAKGADPTRIEAVVRQIAAHLETGDRLVREADAGAAGPSRDAAITLLAEAFGSGVTPEDARELRKLQPMSTEGLASAARGLAFMKDAQLPASDATAVVSEAIRRGFRPHELLDLGREVKRREADYQAGRATLRALREAIARGERPDQLFRETRTDAVTRPAATRVETPVERPAARPDTRRPEQPTRPERPAARER